MPPRGTSPVDPPDTTENTQEQPVGNQPDPSDPPPSDNNNNQPGGDPTILAAYNEQLIAQGRELARLRAEIEKNNAPKPEVERELTEDEEKEFFNKPVSTIKKLVKSEVDASIRPLNQFTANTQKQQILASLKEQMKKQPNQFPYIEVASVEQMFDQILTNAPSIDANAAVTAYNMAVGYAVSNGGIDSLKPRNDNPPPNNSRSTLPVPGNPAHVRPTAPSTPAPGNKKLRTLTEAERKIARFNKMTDAEYIAWTDGVSEKEVATISDEEIQRRAK